MFVVDVTNQSFVLYSIILTSRCSSSLDAVCDVVVVVILSLLVTTVFFAETLAMLDRVVVAVCFVIVLFAALPQASAQQACGTGYCLNGGSCVNNTCVCAVGWTGRYCFDDNTACLPADACNYNGTCIPLTHYTYECDCDSGYFGPRCDWTHPVPNELPGLTAFLMLFAVAVCLFVVGIMWYRREKKRGIKSPISNKIAEWRGRLSGKRPQTYNFNNPLYNQKVQMDNVVSSE
jgi:hypothetical protein